MEMHFVLQWDFFPDYDVTLCAEWKYCSDSPADLQVVGQAMF